MLVAGEFLVSTGTAGGRRFGRLILNRDGGWIWGRLAPMVDHFAMPEYLRGRDRRQRDFVLKRKAVRSQSRIAEAYRFRIEDEDEQTMLLTGRADPDSASWGFDTAPDLVAEYRRNLHVRPSRLHGLGVLTRAPIREGDVIIPLRGDISPRQSRWSVRLDENRHLEPSGYLRFVNHSCEANGVVDLSDPDRPVLRASRAIDMGEEVTFDYLESEGEIVGTFACSCGAETHRF